MYIIDEAPWVLQLISVAHRNPKSSSQGDLCSCGGLEKVLCCSLGMAIRVTAKRLEWPSLFTSWVPVSGEPKATVSHCSLSHRIDSTQRPISVDLCWFIKKYCWLINVCTRVSIFYLAELSPPCSLRVPEINCDFLSWRNQRFSELFFLEAGVQAARSTWHQRSIIKPSSTRGFETQTWVYFLAFSLH